ncbi:MAG TPA: hypothetical protein V6D25_20455 [Leptolyngbyaceae cyanobacterium]
MSSAKIPYIKRSSLIVDRDWGLGIGDWWFDSAVVERSRNSPTGIGDWWFDSSVVERSRNSPTGIGEDGFLIGTEFVQQSNKIFIEGQTLKLITNPYRFILFKF